MAAIVGSVGKGGQNSATDVVKVKELLNERLAQFPVTLPLPLPLTPNADDILVRAIECFQRVAMHSAKPDGRVDPHGKTIKALLGETALNLIQLDKSGYGFRVWGESKRAYGTAAAIESIKSLATGVRGEFAIDIQIGDMSFEHGGPMSPHKSHQHGTDVDIRPLRSDDKMAPVAIGDSHYSHDRTKRLVELLHEDTNLKLILFNDTSIKGVQHWAGHDNHLHVRFKR